MHVASNDLAHFILDDESAEAAIATSMVDFAKWLLDHFKVYFVITNSMVPRDSHNWCSRADAFCKNMTHFNWKIKHLSYNHLQGFY